MSYKDPVTRKYICRKYINKFGMVIEGIGNTKEEAAIDMWSKKADFDNNPLINTNNTYRSVYINNGKNTNIMLKTKFRNENYRKDIFHDISIIKIIRRYLSAVFYFIPGYQAVKNINKKIYTKIRKVFRGVSHIFKKNS